MNKTEKIPLNIDKLSKKHRYLINRYISVHTLMRLFSNKRINLREKIELQMYDFFNSLISEPIKKNKKNREIYSKTFRIYNPQLKIYLDIMFDSYGLMSLNIKSYENDKEIKCKHITDLKEIGRKIFE